MKFNDLFSIIWRNMWKRKTRTIFTMMGVIIGCLAIFIIISITNGFERYLTYEMESLMDTSVISIYPNWKSETEDNKDSTTKTKLTDKNVEELNKLGYFSEVIPKRYAHTQIKYGKNQTYARILANDKTNLISESSLLAGKALKNRSKELLLGYDVAKELLGYSWEEKVKDDSEFQKLIGKRVKLGGEDFGSDDKGNPLKSKQITCNIVGVLSSGNGQKNYEIQGSRKLVEDIIKGAPLVDEEFLKEQLTTYEGIDVRVDDKEMLESYEGTLRNMGYQTSSFKEFEKQTRSMLLGVNIILGSLAGISLLVAALGITNTMDMAIYERNREIGVIKVIGGSVRDVIKIFVGEACAISITGGFISIIFGVLATLGINSVAKSITENMMGQPIEKISVPSFSLILGILVFCLVIGFIAGILPARKAAKTDVITAIR
ncbi:ABC transporter permease [Clostridium perfringens]|uniref:ABC transporter permease n=1 Tax=Clostridium perfringens TaxID=1502 RepID=UPI000ABE83A1|nr:FtsX-like permease family protein [Clostridium perfringens]MDU2654077.1 FtsX-like permease family protein [Clostridium perfringens]MDU7782735.1 FtsX-like permease family protein [Clostridium perfringens]MDU7897341.1 FtsX-like permease family protein [Clostridium perfringens]MDZ5044997.1 FtsX-like permease family protein [Clostridium perfringens]MDZ5050639.1 FtsX-like permease family protein [Clostridium perfringens]